MRSVRIKVLSLVLHANCGGGLWSFPPSTLWGVHADFHAKAHVESIKSRMLDQPVGRVATICSVQQLDLCASNERYVSSPTDGSVVEQQKEF